MMMRDSEYNSFVNTLYQSPYAEVRSAFEQRRLLLFKCCLDMKSLVMNLKKAIIYFIFKPDKEEQTM